MTKGHHLRPFETGGDQMHNYRLFPPDGLSPNDDVDEQGQLVEFIPARAVQAFCAAQ